MFPPVFPPPGVVIERLGLNMAAPWGTKPDGISDVRLGATIDGPIASMPTFPEWWNWDLSFTGHAELRMEQRGVTEVEVRAMLERATGFEASVVEGRFMVQTRRGQSPWVVIVEPDAESTLLVVVTAYEVSQ
jgi:hypothetical protein